jgi:alanyl-tRNA synthetase
MDKSDRWPGLEFVGYELLETQSLIRKYRIEDDTVHLILDKTPFYAESGGEIGDVGIIEGRGFRLKIDDVRKINSFVVHSGRFEDGNAIDNAEVKAVVDKVANLQIRANNNSTHLLQAALRQILEITFISPVRWLRRNVCGSISRITRR